MIKDRAIILLAFGETLAWAGLYYIFSSFALTLGAGLRMVKG